MSELKSLESEKHVAVDSSISAAEGDIEYGAEVKTTHRHLKPRHVQLIAISGAIGTGLFIGTGGALARAGPLSLLLGYAIYGALVLCSFNSMGEMVSYLPIDGSYLRFAGRFVDPSYGFAMGWVATYNNAVTVAAEATAVAGLMAFWNDTISPGVWCALFLASALALNVFGVRFFGEGEFWFSIFKILLVFMLFFFTFITMIGGNPQGDRYGFRNWKEGGVMNEHIAEGSLGRFLGFWSVFIQAAFAYGGPDFLAMTAGEARYPRRILPNVFRRVIYRLLFFYIGGVLCVGILVPSNDPLLGTAQKGAGSSPFVLASVRMGIPILPHIINALILTSAWSCGICLSFTASRNLYSNALSGHAPSFFKKTWRGVPHFCVLAVVAVGLLSFMTLSGGAAEAFSWITNILGGLWILNLALQQVIYIRFRAGLAALGIDRKTLPFWVRGQLVYSWIALVGYTIIFLTNGFGVFVKGNWNIRSFAFAYLTLPFFIVCYGGHKIYMVVRFGSRWGILRPDEMDLVTGKAEVDEDEKTYPIPGTSKSAKFQTWLWG